MSRWAFAHLTQGLSFWQIITKNIGRKIHLSYRITLKKMCCCIQFQLPPPPPNTQTTNTHTHTRTRHFFNDLAPSPSNFSYPASNTLFAHTPHLYIAHSWLIKKKKGQQILLAHNQNNNYVFLNKFVFVGLFNLKKPTTKNSQLWAMYTPTPPQRLKFWKHCEEYGKEIH